jgi:hypothetical protein
MAVGDAVDVWVDGAHGSDSNTGASRASALATVDAAWRRIPMNTPLTRGVRIMVASGTYPASALPTYWESRWGTSAAPIFLQAADGAHTVTFTGDINAYDVRHVGFVGIDVSTAGDAFHCQRCSYVLLRDMRLDGHGLAQETIKANQSDHLYVEDSDVSGAWDNAIDFVAVQYGHVVGSRIHGAGDWCAYAKGGSAYLTIAANEIYDCGTGGFTAGQGTGFEYMVAPWLHYEAYGIRVVNNVVHDTSGAGLGVNGGYDILMAYNTLYRIGTRSHLVEFVHGARGCDGDTAACAARLAVGGWGVGAGEGGQWIPNKHVRFMDNVVANPDGVVSAWSQFAVHGPATAPAGSNVPAPSLADDDLVIAGNVISNGGAGMDLGFADDACGPTNPTCSATLVLATNWVNSVVPALGTDYCPAAGSAVGALAAAPIPDVGWADAPSRPAVPAGTSSSQVPRTKAGSLRVGWGRPGAC